MPASRTKSSVGRHRPPTAEENQAFAISDSEAAAAPTKGQIPPRRGRQNAIYWLKRREVDPQASIYTSEELRVAATVRAAELQVPRNIRLSKVELHILSLASSANGLVAGWR